MLNTLPEQLETDRLLIRVARPGDGPGFNRAVLESLDHLCPWVPWSASAPSLEQSEAYCREAYARFLLNESLRVLFFLRDGGTLVGGGGLPRLDWELRSFELGYWGHVKHCGQGLVAEGSRAVTEYALEQLGANRVVAYVDDRNHASSRMAERLGFQLEGVLRKDSRDALGTLRDSRVYAKLPARLA